MTLIIDLRQIPQTQRQVSQVHSPGLPGHSMQCSCPLFGIFCVLPMPGAVPGLQGESGHKSTELPKPGPACGRLAPSAHIGPIQVLT